MLKQVQLQANKARSKQQRQWAAEYRWGLGHLRSSGGIDRWRLEETSFIETCWNRWLMTFDHRLAMLHTWEHPSHIDCFYDGASWQSDPPSSHVQGLSAVYHISCNCISWFHGFHGVFLQAWSKLNWCHCIPPDAIGTASCCGRASRGARGQPTAGHAAVLVGMIRHALGR